VLPEIKKTVLQDLNFVKDWQTVIFRNYSYVPTENIASVLKTDVAVIDKEASRLGLVFEEQNLIFSQKGYQTIIRNNWFILPYSQLTTLTKMTEERLNFILREEDFFAGKLGGFKPCCEEVYYCPLTEDEIVKTEKIASVIKKYLQKDKVKPFEFFDSLNKNCQTDSARKVNDNNLIVHGYLSPCGNAFKTDSREYLTDQLLSEYANCGIKGIWIHGVLSTLSYNPFNPEESVGYEDNRKELKSLIDRALKFGIKIYLYLNEPRRIPLEKFKGQEHLCGTVLNGFGSLCTSTKEVREYLYNAVKDLVVYCENLGGIFNITMSEYLTHCKSHVQTDCPRCKDIPMEELCADTINLIAKAVRDSGKNTEMIANLWGWSPNNMWNETQILHGIELIDKDVSIMETSEFWLDLNKGGVKLNLVDYSVSNPGPSKLSALKYKKAKQKGHKVYAKVQFNNSWECSCVPYLPAFDLVVEHLNNLQAVGVKNLLLSWTTGGYPSKTLKLVNEFYSDTNFSLEKFYKDNYNYPEIVKKAVSLFCEGFRSFPFSINVLYYSPHTLGPSNLWSLKQENKRSSMVCFSFDDYKNYTSPYPYAVYVRLYRKLLNRFMKAMDLLEKYTSDKDICEIYNYIRVAYVHFKADLLQTRFSHYKNKPIKNKEVLLDCLNKERQITVELIKLIAKDARIGFEASNHYFYTERNLLEKIINTDKLIEELTSI